MSPGAEQLGDDPERFQLLDACSTINLWASRMLADILASEPIRFGIADIVLEEALFVRRGGSGDDADEREPIDLDPFITAGLIVECSVSGPLEEGLFLQLASELDDGEAATCAIAIIRGHAIVTDDQKTLRALRRDYPQARLQTTSMIVKAWADRTGATDAQLAEVLTDIERRGRFRPGKHDPLQAWWQRVISPR